MQEEKTRLWPQTPEDLLRESIWSSDAEIQALDVQAGVIVNTQVFSIKTLDGKHIGLCSLYNFSEYEGQLGIRIGDKDYWDKGYGTDATRALVNHYFTTTSITRIWLKVIPTNTRAIRCYEKCGFTRCGKFVLDGIEFVMMEIRK